MPPYKRRIFLINKKFQFRMAFYVCSWVFIMGFIYPLIVENIFDMYINYVKNDPNGPGVAALVRARDDLVSLLFAIQVLFLALTFAVSLFLAHRVAGPLHKVKLFFAKVKAGDLSEDMYFRTHDHFKELAAEYNQMAVALRQRIAKTAVHIENAAARSTDAELRRELRVALDTLPKIVAKK